MFQCSKYTHVYNSIPIKGAEKSVIGPLNLTTSFRDWCGSTPHTGFSGLFKVRCKGSSFPSLAPGHPSLSPFLCQSRKKIYYQDRRTDLLVPTYVRIHTNTSITSVCGSSSSSSSRARAPVQQFGSCFFFPGQTGQTRQTVTDRQTERRTDEWVTLYVHEIST